MPKREQWEYGQQADITIGEKKVSKAPKIILGVLVAFLLSSLVLGYFYREEVYAYLVNPHATLKQETVELEVGDKIDLKSFVLNDYKNQVEVEIPKEMEMNHPGEFDFIYKSKNALNEKEMKLKVVVKDKIKPVIELKNDLLVLERGEATDKFDIKAQVKDYLDNYSKKEKLEVIYPEKPDFSKPEAELVYKVKDESGNEGEAKLRLVINDKPKEVIKEVIKEVKVEVPTQTQTTPAPSRTQTQTTARPSTPAPAPAPAPTPAPAPRPAQPFINGVRNHTVKVGTSIQSIASLVSSGVSGSGYISVDFSSVNTTVPGSYPVRFSSSDGVNKTATITVVE